MGNTAYLSASDGTSYKLWKFLNVLQPGGSWTANSAPAKAVWEYNASNIWEGRYSTPGLAVPTISGTASGTGATGLVTTPAAAIVVSGTILGTPTYSWSLASGDAGITISSSTAPNPTWSKTLGGYSNAFWNVTLTDPQTGATVTVSNILVEVTYAQTATPTVSVFGQVIWSWVASGHIFTTCQAQAVITPGGSGPYTFAWAYKSGFTGFTVSNPNTQNPMFYDNMFINYNSGNPPQVVDTGTWTCTVNGANGYVAIITANITMQGSILNAT